jgi:hypothetical protein
MAELLAGLSQLQLPRFVRVAQSFEDRVEDDIALAVARELERPEILARLQPGKVAAVAVGSRGIANLVALVSSLVTGLSARGLKVIIVPAMGSHGGATADGQQRVLADYGITAESVGAPIVSSMAADRIGALRFDAESKHYQPSEQESATDVPVFLDATALRQADLIIPVVRVKPHTGFRGDYESGICKMLSIGLGKHLGCSRMHREGYGRFAELIPAAARLTLATGKIAFALSVVENAYDHTARIEAVDADHIMQREPELLSAARVLMPRIVLPRIDVLVIDEIGKDISGTGMDGNIVGRSELGRLRDFNGPDIARIVVLGLSEKTHGNAAGIGLADIITERAFHAIDRNVTYTNVLTSGSLSGGKIPLALPSDDEAILAAASCVPGVDPRNATVVRIRNTLLISEIAVSENLVPIVEKTPGLRVLGSFDGNW